MSHYLDQAACEDKQRREDLASNDAAQTFSDQQLKQEPFPVMAARHELEEVQQEAGKIAADVAADIALDVNKGPRLAARNDAHAMALQVQFQGHIGALS
jgi:hypothetical protein